METSEPARQHEKLHRGALSQHCYIFIFPLHYHKYYCSGDDNWSGEHPQEIKTLAFCLMSDDCRHSLLLEVNV